MTDKILLRNATFMTDVAFYSQEKVHQCGILARSNGNARPVRSIYRRKILKFYERDFLVFAARNNDKITLIHIGPEKSFKSCQIMEKSLKISFRVKGIKVWENIYSLNK